MSSYGVLDTGFRRKTFEVLLAEIAADQKALFGNEFDTSADSVTGQLNGVFADRLADLWELAEAVYASAFPNSASGASLRNLGLLTGVIDLGAAPTEVRITVFSAGGTVVNVGDTITASDGVIYEAKLATVIPSGVDTVVKYFAQDDGPIAAPAGFVFLSPSSLGLTASPASITSVNVEPFDLTAGATLVVEIGGRTSQSIQLVGGAAETASAVAGLLNNVIVGGSASDSGGAIKIETDTSDPTTLANTVKVTADNTFGFPLDAVEFGRPANLSDGILGRDVESDAEFRARRQQRLNLAGSSTVDAILSAVGDVEDVSFVNVIENDTSFVSPAPDSLPPHSFEVVVEGGTELSIAEAIFNDKPAGIQAYSGAGVNEKVSLLVPDTAGNSHLIEFSRPTAVAIVDLDITLTHDSSYGGGDVSAGNQAVKDALSAFIEALQPGDDIIYRRFSCVALEVPGVVDVTVFTYDVGAGPITVNTSIDNRSLVTMAQAVIEVTPSLAA